MLLKVLDFCIFCPVLNQSAWSANGVEKPGFRFLYFCPVLNKSALYTLYTEEVKGFGSNINGNNIFNRSLIKVFALFDPL